MRKLPCVDCICLAICRAKRMSQVVSCENIVEFLARPAPPIPDHDAGAMLSNGSYVHSDDWDEVCVYLNKPEHRIQIKDKGDKK